MSVTVQVEALQWTGENLSEVEAFAHDRVDRLGDGTLRLAEGEDDLEGEPWYVRRGAWIVKLSPAHFYVSWTWTPGDA